MDDVSNPTPVNEGMPTKATRTGGSRAEYAAVLLTGVLLTLAFPLQFWSFAVPPSWQGYTAWIAYAPLIWVGRTLTPRRFAWMTGLASWMMFTATTFWIVVAMVDYGHIPMPIAIAVLSLLSTILASFHALAGFSAARISRMLKLELVWTFPVCLTALEFARNYVLTGFPWSNIAYSQARFLGMIQLADITGIYGLTFLIALTGASLPSLWHSLGPSRRSGSQDHRVLRPVLLALVLVVAARGYGALRISQLEGNDATSRTLKVALLQGNIPQDEKWLAEKSGDILSTYTRLTENALDQGAELVVWPEASVPNLLPAELEYMPEQAFPSRGPGVQHIIGVPTYLPRLGDADPFVMHNSAFLVDPSRRILGRYDKSHLVPFGEYVPLRSLFFFLGPLVQAVGTFLPGEEIAPLTDSLYRYGILVCYEDIFPEIARELGRKGAEILVNVTNDAWYGPTSALQQHLDMAVFRAIENRVPVARAANTGISAFVSPTGAVLAQTKAWEEAVLLLPIQLRPAASPYIALGDAFAWLCVALTLLGLGGPELLKRRKAASAEPQA